MDGWNVGRWEEKFLLLQYTKLAVSNYNASVNGGCNLLVPAVNNVTAMTTLRSDAIPITQALRDGAFAAETN